MLILVAVAAALQVVFVAWYAKYRSSKKLERAEARSARNMTQSIAVRNIERAAIESVALQTV